MKHTQSEPEPVPPPGDGAEAPQGLELRHLRSRDLPRPLQQMLFQTADNLATPPPPQPAELASPTAA